jgi:hypothetical protein
VPSKKKKKTNNNNNNKKKKKKKKKKILNLSCLDVICAKEKNQQVLYFSEYCILIQTVDKSIVS